MVGLISGWLGSTLASGATAGKPVEDAETVGGLSEVLAEILAGLQATFAGQALDVEISYEPSNKVGALYLSVSAHIHITAYLLVLGLKVMQQQVHQGSRHALLMPVFQRLGHSQDAKYMNSLH